MLKQTLAILLCLLLVIPGAAQTSDKQLAKETKRKQQLIEWGTNKNVVVKLTSGEKIEGRLAEIKDDVFAVQFVEKDKITAREIRYSEVSKLSAKDGGKAGKIVGYTALGVLAGVGVMFLVVLGIWARN